LLVTLPPPPTRTLLPYTTLFRSRLDHACNPAQDEVHGGHELHLQGVWVESKLARRQRLFPDSTKTRFDLLPIAEGHAGDVLTFAAVIRHDHADVTNRDQHFRPNLDRREPAVDKKCAVGQ